eukprot:TRINITY_DN13609_c0_g1_i1.p1 TRINITY_DN13609_c0_g1~~TRINITY_DN13609_c0_g1_i1.p1  ORF type:complete len:616 (+),score=197.26 TRINITY_DN13609_c0_g1_i1:38-1885(+)
MEGKDGQMVGRDEVKLREKEVKKETKMKMKKYKKDDGNVDQARYVGEIDQSGRLKKTLRNAKRMKEAAVRSAAKSEMVHNTEEAGFLELDDGEQGRDISQKQIVGGVDVQTKRKRFDIRLDKLGPYTHAYSPNGNMLVLAGEKGHLSTFHWKNFRLFGEVQLRDKCYDVTFLHDDQLLATAQKKYVYIYNNKGNEIHLLKNHQNIRALDFLPNHFLLTGVGTQGVLHYFDVSIGEHIAAQRTKMGPCGVLRKNPYNAVSALGHTSGVVSLWSPKATAPLVKVLAHQAPLVDVAFPLDGRYMVTAGADSMVKVWDTRTWKMLHNIAQKTAPKSLDISQTGLLAVSSYSKVEVWKDWTGSKPRTPYLTHCNANKQDTISRVRYCPYEDILGESHVSGFGSIIVPGSGEANYDYYVANPYETQQQRKERPVHMLLDKLPPEMITLNPRAIGKIDTRKAKEKRELKKLHERQQEHQKKKQQQGGVEEGDIDSSDVENTIVRPDELPSEKERVKIRRPKHLKEKKLYLQKQEHQRWKAKQAAKRKRAELSSGRKAGEGEGDGEEVQTMGDIAAFEKSSPFEESEKKVKRRKKVIPKMRDALDTFYSRAEEYKKAEKTIRR